MERSLTTSTQSFCGKVETYGFSRRGQMGHILVSQVDYLILILSFQMIFLYFDCFRSFTGQQVPLVVLFQLAMIEWTF